MKGKKIALVALLLSCIFSAHLGVKKLENRTTVASTQSTVAKDYYKGVEMSNGANAYQLSTGFAESPKTMETVVWLTGATNGLGRCGVAIGACWEAVDGDKAFNIEFSETRKPILWWNNGEIWWEVNYSIPAYSWANVTFVRDTVADKIYCYINGNLVDERVGAGTEIATPTAKHWIGRDARDGATLGESSFLMGSLNYVGLSSETLTSAQIQDGFYHNKRIIQSYDDTPILSEDLSQQVRAYYRSEEKVDKTPLTLTATVKTTAYEAGSILSTYCNANGYNTVNLEMTWDGYVKLRWDPLMNGGTEAVSVIFNDSTSLKINTGNKVHIAVVKDTANYAFKLYLNGSLASTKTVDGNPAWFAWENVPTLGFALGRDLNVDADWKQMKFKGEIYDAGVYSKALTAAQLSAEYSTRDKTSLTKDAKLSGSETGLMANWVLTARQSKLVYYENYLDPVLDYSGNENHARVCTMAHYMLPEKDWFEADGDEYTMVYLPDTQIVVRSSPHYIDTMFQWMIDNADAMNLSFVMGLGDITDGKPLAGDTSIPGIDVDQQWDRMQANYDKLTNAGIYWSAIVGNHDYDDNGLSVANGRKADKYNEHFGYDTLSASEQKTVVARFDNNSMQNAIYEYSVTTGNGQTVNYLLVAVEFGPSDEVLQWAGNIISQEKYKGHRVLFNTHSLIYHNGEFAGENTIYDPEYYPWANASGLNFNNGQQIWTEFLSQHENVFMAASGHIGTDSVEKRTDEGVNGNKVFSFLCDGQGTKVYADYDGDGGWGEPLILVVKVNEKTQTMKFNYYDPVNNMMLGVENQFEISFGEEEPVDPPASDSSDAEDSTDSTSSEGDSAVEDSSVEESAPEDASSPGQAGPTVPVFGCQASLCTASVGLSMLIALPIVCIKKKDE